MSITNTVTFTNGHALMIRDFGNARHQIIAGEPGTLRGVAIDPSSTLFADQIGTLLEGLLGGEDLQTAREKAPDGGYEHQLEVAGANARLCFVAGSEFDAARIVDADGEEYFYWDAEEFIDDPLEVFGAIVGALSRGASAARKVIES